MKAVQRTEHHNLRRHHGKMRRVERFRHQESEGRAGRISRTEAVLACTARCLALWEWRTNYTRRNASQQPVKLVRGSLVGLEQIAPIFGRVIFFLCT